MSKIIVPERTVLEWFFFTDKKPKTTTCLFSDGVSYYAGFYSPTDQCIYLNGVAGEQRKMELIFVDRWGELSNMFRGW